MKNLWILLLVVAVASAAFFLGRRSGNPEEATPVATPAASATQGDPAVEINHGPSAEPVRTFRGPDGVAWIIVYDDKNPPDRMDPKQVSEALRMDMKNHPKNIERSYRLSSEDIDAILAGSKPIPDYMLPKPAAPAK